LPAAAVKSKSCGLLPVAEREAALSLQNTVLTFSYRQAKRRYLGTNGEANHQAISQPRFLDWFLFSLIPYLPETSTRGVNIG
jgi:hypothetical protein